MVLEQDLDERQIVALLPDTPGPAFATTNAPALFRLSGERVRTGTYTSPVLDAGSVARFGTLRWRGDAPPGSELELSLRSGISSEPDATWSPWTSPGRPAENGELQVDGLPRGRYVQWRLEMTAPRKGAGASPRVDGVELSYRQANLRPEIESFEAMDPGQILVPAGFNPTLQVFEPAHPTGTASSPPWSRRRRTARDGPRPCGRRATGPSAGAPRTPTATTWSTRSSSGRCSGEEGATGTSGADGRRRRTGPATG